SKTRSLQQIIIDPLFTSLEDTNDKSLMSADLQGDTTSSSRLEPETDTSLETLNADEINDIKKICTDLLSREMKLKQAMKDNDRTSINKHHGNYTYLLQVLTLNSNHQQQRKIENTLLSKELPTDDRITLEIMRDHVEYLLQEQNHENIRVNGSVGKWKVLGEVKASPYHRDYSEDTFLVSKDANTFGVIDGMSTSIAPRFFAHKIRHAIEDYLRSDPSLRLSDNSTANRLVAYVSRRMTEYVNWFKQNLEEDTDEIITGATAILTRLWEDEQGSMIDILSAGDCRAYLAKADYSLQQLTTDRTHLNDLLTEHAAGHLRDESFMTDPSTFYTKVNDIPNLRQHLIREFIKLVNQKYSSDKNLFTSEENRIFNSMDTFITKNNEAPTLFELQGAFFGTINAQVTSNLGDDVRYARDLDLSTHRMKPGERLILTTDGIHDNLTREELEHILQTSRTNADFIQKVRETVEQKMVDGKRDDMTILIIGVNEQK
ncbi:MAG: SpoIIE family protein phosphatase, partial [Patescibacteria group bacterium]